MCIGIVRFIAIKYPLTRIPTKVIYFVWFIQLCAGIIAFGLTYQVSLSIGDGSNFIAYLLTYGSMSALCILLCVILNLILCRTITKSKLNLNEIVFQKHKKASKRLSFINLVYIICSTPAVVISFVLVAKLSQLTDKTQESAITLVNYFLVMFWSFDIYVLYSGLNAVIYVGFDQKIIAYYKNCYCHRFCCRHNHSP